MTSCNCRGLGRCDHCRRTSNVIEITHHGRMFTETEWTRRWERTMRHENWVEHQGLFYPRGTPPTLMTNRRETTPPVRRLGGG